MQGGKVHAMVDAGDQTAHDERDSAAEENREECLQKKSGRHVSESDVPVACIDGALDRSVDEKKGLKDSGK